jgi:formamidopyrimidine-DNA glycosylase
MYVQTRDDIHPAHVALVLELDRHVFVYQDTRFFGRFTLDTTALEKLGPEPLGGQFTPALLQARLSRSSQALKVKLLDQKTLAGLGNIYVSEALFRARIHPATPANRLSALETRRLHAAIRWVLKKAIALGSSIPLTMAATQQGDGMFYFGARKAKRPRAGEKFQVYDRAGKPCFRCKQPVRRSVQAARSTFHCGKCQKPAP